MSCIPDLRVGDQSMFKEFDKSVQQLRFFQPYEFFLVALSLQLHFSLDPQALVEIRRFDALFVAFCLARECRLITSPKLQ